MRPAPISFPQINPGQYTFSGSLPGFQTFSRTVVVRSGNTNIEDAVLYVARTVISVEVSVSAPQTTNIPPSTLASSNWWQHHRTHPDKPGEAAVSGSGARSGDSGLRATPRRCGCERSGCLAPAGSVSWQREFPLVQAAMEAVRQWRYRPATLNGQPIEFPTTITVNFTFQ